MVRVEFKEVGQGDSIVLEWTNSEGVSCFGLVDCNQKNGFNPSLDFVKSNTHKSFEFIILSHFHEDHYSGLADIFEYCTANKIRVKVFYHTMGEFLSDFYNRIDTTKRTENAYERFFTTFEEFDCESERISIRTMPISLTKDVKLSFLSPTGNVYDKFAKQLARKRNKVVTTQADVNKLATIIIVEGNSSCFLLTSDAVKSSFSRIRGQVQKKVKLLQAPHHGSFPNVDPFFWNQLNLENGSPAVFSVGESPKDKLPNIETVVFFSNLGLQVCATNEVYGIAEFQKKTRSTTSEVESMMNIFSTVVGSTEVRSTPYSGNQIFRVQI